MYYYSLKCVLYTPQTPTLPNTLFQHLPKLDLAWTSQLENYNHVQDKSVTRRRRSSQHAKPDPSTQNIPPTPIDVSKTHTGHRKSLEGQVDFRLGPIEVHAMSVMATSKKKKRIEEHTTSLGYGILHLYRHPEPVQGDNVILCVLAVPSYLTYKDFTNFLGPANANIDQYRFIK